VNRKPSPNYPRMTLSDSLDRIRRVYKHQQTHPATPEVIAQALGYSTLNGASKGVIATLKQYGLLETAGSGLRVSDQSISILELPEGDPDRRRSLATIMLNPAVCADLNRGFGEELPANAKLVLVKKGFTPKAADEIVRIYRANVQFVLIDRADSEVNSNYADDAKGGKGLTAPDQPPPVRGAHREGGFAEQTLLFKIAESTEARIQLRGVVTQEAIRKLIALLELSVDTFAAGRAATA
jgi:hypothetical protein